MSILISLFFILCSSNFISTLTPEGYSIVNINELEKKSEMDNMYASNKCYKRDVDFQEKEWPFRTCYEDLHCPAKWDCTDCVCEPINPKNYIYIYKGFFNSSDPWFYEDPLSYFSYKNRINTILLQLSSDSTKAMILPIKNEKEIEGYEIGDTIKIMPSGCEFVFYDKRCVFDIYNESKKNLKIRRSLYICENDNYDDCSRLNYKITHGHEDSIWLDRRRIFNF